VRAKPRIKIQLAAVRKSIPGKRPARPPIVMAQPVKPAAPGASAFVSMVANADDLSKSAPYPDGNMLRPELVIQKCSFSVNYNPNVGNTSSAFCITPDPCCLVHNPSNTAAGSNPRVALFPITPTTVVQASTVTAGTQCNTTEGGMVQGPVSISTLAQSAAAYRVTACTVTLRSQLGANQQAINITLQQIPIVNTGLNLNTLANVGVKTTDAYANSFIGNQVQSVNLLSGATKRLTTFDVLENALEIKMLPTESRAFNWRTTCTSKATDFTQIVSNYAVGDFVLADNTLGSVDTSNGVGSALDMRGWPMLTVSLSGPTTNLATLQVDVDLRYEVVRFQSNDLGLYAGSAPIGGPTSLAQVMASLEKLPIYRVVRCLAEDGRVRQASKSLLMAATGIRL